MNDKIIRRLLALFAVIAAILVAVAIVAVRNINRAVAASDWVNHTHAVILELGEIRSAFHASDAALSTLALTGGPLDEAACREAEADLSEHIEVAKALTRNAPSQAAQIGRLETLAAARTKLTRDVLAARSEGNTGAIGSLLAADAAAGTIMEVRRVVEGMKLEQMGLLADRDTAAYVQAQTTRWTVWSGVILNFLLLGLTAWLVMDDVAARRRAAAIMREANEQLEIKVKERTADLTRSNERLEAENLERRWSAQALEHQLRYNELIINSISDLVMVLTKAQNISRINPAVGHLTGFDSTQVINRRLPDLVRLKEVPRHLAASADPVGQALKDGRDVREMAATIIDRQSREIPVRFNLFPIRDHDKVVGAVVVLRTETASA